jgi:hypothetical protein
MAALSVFSTPPKLTSLTSTQVTELSQALRDGRGHLARVADVGLHGQDPTVQRFDLLDRLLHVGLRRHRVGDRVEGVQGVDRDDVGPLASEVNRVAASLPPRRAGDQCDLAR